jgi:hypothetical protein
MEGWTKTLWFTACDQSYIALEIFENATNQRINSVVIIERKVEKGLNIQDSPWQNSRPQGSHRQFCMASQSRTRPSCIPWKKEVKPDFSATNVAAHTVLGRPMRSLGRPTRLWAAHTAVGGPYGHGRPIWSWAAHTAVGWSYTARWGR